MFNPKLNLNLLNELGKGNMLEHLGIEFTEVSNDYLIAKMPVDYRTTQPFKMLHGGASVVLAETLGSIASNFIVNEDQYCVGLEVNANHVKGVPSGEFVYGKVMPLHLGKRTHVWDIRISNGKGQLVCVSRITMSVLDKK